MRVEILQPEAWDNFGDYSIINQNVVMTFPVLIPEEGIKITVEHTGKNNQEGSVSVRISDEPYGSPLLYPNPAYNTFSLPRIKRQILLTRTHIDGYAWEVPISNIVYFGFANLENKLNYFSFFTDDLEPPVEFKCK